MIRVDKVKYYHHRWEWMQAYGPIPEGALILHTCDVRNCINVEHLFLGTQRDNMQDMAAKGRQWQQAKTHCPHGHEYTEENTVKWSGSGRKCKACEQLRSKQRRS